MELSRRFWISVLVVAIAILSSLVFLLGYYGIEYSQPVPEIARIKVALFITAIVVVGGVGSFYAILYRTKIFNAVKEIKEVDHDAE